jgi:hypothetical protein
MADAIERIYKLTVDGTQAIRQLDKIEQATAGTDTKLGKLGNTIKGGLAAFAITEATGRVVSFLQDTARAMDDLGDQSQKLGVAAEALETFRLAADMSGSSADDVDRALKSLSKSMTEFDAGTKGAVEAFAKIGVNPSGKDTATVLEEIADAFKDLPDDANKTASAMELLGKAGADLIPMLNGGSDGLQAFNQQLRDLGMVLSQDDIANAQRLGDAMDNVGKASEGVARSFMTGLTPALADIVESFTATSVAAEKWNYYGKQTGLLLKGLVEAATGTAQAFVEMGNVGVAAFKSLTTFDLTPVKQAWASFENFGQRYTATMAKLDEEGKRIEEDRTFERIAKAISLPEYNDEKPKRAAAAIADTGKAAKGAAKEVDDYARVLKQLDSEYDGLLGKLEGWNRAETLQHQLLRDGTKLTAEQTTALLARADAIEELTRKLQDQADIEAGFQAAVAAGEATTTGLEQQAKAWKDVLDPMAQYQRNWETIAKLGDAGMLSESEVWAAWAKNSEDATKAAKQLADQADPTKQAWVAVGTTIQDALGQGLADVLLDSEKGIKDWTSSFLQQMARILMNKAIMQLLFGSGGMGSGGGLWGMASSAVGGLFSSSAPTGVAMSTMAAPAALPSPDSMMLRAATPMALAAAAPSPITTYDVGTLTSASTSRTTGQDQTGAPVVTNITVNTDGTSTSTGDDVRLAKKIDSAVKNVIVNEMRPGGLLSGARSA